MASSAVTVPAAPTSATQLTFALGHLPAMGRDDFLVAPSNRDAVAWIDLWPDWPGPALILYGPPSCGKTHLAAVWRDRVGAGVLDSPDTAQAPADLLAGHAHLVIDRADDWIGSRETETALFHLYNLAREAGKSLLLLSRTAPVRLPFTLPDLASRLRAAPVAPIAAPDDQLLGAVLVKLFADRQLAVNEDVIRYILPRIERSFAAAQDLVTRADAASLTEKRAVSVPMLRHLLRDDSAGSVTP